jgi:hypothetical protein
MKNSFLTGSPFRTHRATRNVATCNRILLRLALLITMLFPGACVPAQATKAAQPVHHVGPPKKRQTLDDRVAQLARYLDLSEGQRSTLKDILVQNQQEILKMRGAPSPPEGLQMDRFRAIEDKTAERIRAMLSEEQRKKYDPLGARNSNSAVQDVSVEDWLKQTTPR